MPLCSH